ncbi:MAG: [FeFe] hydrogenase H-cluster radical SAM maturase HydE [Lentisphaerae bacterium]|nr:[FeFe] hydrogenase H-cluster radical SAM maturase HydE [Lentisphaerota bacterium]
MCYAIPGKVVELNGRHAVIDYFGERRQAYTDLTRPSPGDYVYAQGGFVIQTVPAQEALAILADWQELFFRLQQTDQKLAQRKRTLHEQANAVRQQFQGNSCCVHGILEFSNYCRNNCLYCGIRKDNRKLQRYRMSEQEILQAVEYAVNQLGFRALVLQSGEDFWYSEAKLCRIVREIRARFSVLIFLSLGERPRATYHKLYEAGARGALIRFETSDAEQYKKIKPESTLADRLGLIKDLRDLGYLIISGFLMGLPDPTAGVAQSGPRGQNGRNVLADIKRTAESGAEMFSFGPFIPHPETPLAAARGPRLATVLNAIAQARLMYPTAKILVTTALETLDPAQGARAGLMAGANSLMINITPQKYRRLYEIYPNRAGVEDDTPKRIDKLLELLHALGRAPTDIGVS